MRKCEAGAYIPYFDKTVCDGCFHKDVCSEGDYLTEDKCSAYLGWISVKERLPESEHTRVLVYLIDAVPQGGKPKMDTDRYVNGRWVRWNGRITHWMHLPEPPKEDAEK